MFFAPHEGGRHVAVTDQRTKVDFVHCMQALADCYFAEVEVIQVVFHNLNTHTPAAPYEAFPPWATAYLAAVRLPLHTEAEQPAEDGRD